ncbi:uncharacterized protein A1O9_08667 [Exophiala aquamarina CBS 119918]|uniref:Uncharacterized protein n=1 Tax=Exophiala aquamarina CBS 119918 TaxID=1182545 RepID=A0A072P4I3_9EURO|nr:uncharacterized protein A1O9_08667 [Exophiala aquamarina CBS 119918]KEF55014.1 hypothetical protein A1O9_08667 [Exophiala aquamarina CBS 119918]
MRNLIFERKPPPKKRGRHARAVSPALTVDTESDIAYQGDTDTHPLPSPALTYYPKDADLRARVMSTRLSHETQGRRKMLTMRQADDAILDLIDRLAEIRAHTNPRVFEECWDRRIGRLKELDSFFNTREGNQETKNQTMEIPEQRTSAHNAPAPPQALSSQPFVSTGSPVQPQMPHSCLVPPTPPTHMSIWISTCGIISAASLFGVPLTTASAIYSAHSPDGPTSSVSSAAYHWPNAPVLNSDIAPFFQGMSSRVDPPTSTILGWVLSYGWNDRCRFISSGLTELCNNTNDTASDQNSQCGDNTPASTSPAAQEANAELGSEMDIDSTPSANYKTNLPTQAALLSPGSKMATALAKQTDDFDEEQWASIKLGWRGFQDDLREAARMGVKVWRMKVCVLNLTQ